MKLFEINSELKKYLLETRKNNVKNFSNLGVTSINYFNGIKDDYTICSLPFALEPFELVIIDENFAKKGYIVTGDICVSIPYKTVQKEIDKQIEIGTLSDPSALYDKYYEIDNQIYTAIMLLISGNSNPNCDSFTKEYYRYCQGIGQAREAKIYSNLLADINEKETFGVQYVRKNQQ